MADGHMDPIFLSDGIYTDHRPSGRLGAIDAVIEAARLRAKVDGVVWLIFNGTSVRVMDGDTAVDVYQRWTTRREAYQRSHGIR